MPEAQQGCTDALGPEEDGYPSDCRLLDSLRGRAMRRNRPLERGPAWKEALVPASRVRLFLLDVDGVLTDGGIFYSEEGGEIKRFHSQDGFGLRLLQEAGVEVGLITARDSAIVRRRALDLGISRVHQGVRDKLGVYESILRETGLRPPQTAYMGDDWLDLPLLNRAGLSLAPSDAVPEVRQRVHYVCENRGGQGAAREACDLILAAREGQDALLARYDR